MTKEEQFDGMKDMVNKFGSKTRAAIVVQVKDDGTSSYNVIGDLSDLVYAIFILENYAHDIQNGAKNMALLKENKVIRTELKNRV